MTEFLGNATEGFIYMSLGCNMKSNILPSNVQEAIHNTFLKLPYKVLWKYESDNIPKSSKIFTSKWISQQSVLGNSNSIISDILANIYCLIFKTISFRPR